MTSSVSLTTLTLILLLSAQYPATVASGTEERDDEIVGAAPVPLPLLQRVAARERVLKTPQSLYEIVVAIEGCFGTKISIEPLPEHCVGSMETEILPAGFSIFEGEALEAVIDRLEVLTQGRWIFEEIHGVPLLRPDKGLQGHGNLLDTVVTLDIKADSMWEALCALALAVNSANDVHQSNTRPLLIMFVGPSILKHPPAAFIKKKPMVVSLHQTPARVGLCAVLEQTSDHIRYLYDCVEKGTPPLNDEITINMFDSDGRVVDGGKVRGDEYIQFLETKAWMSVEGLMKAQIPTPTQAE